MNIVVYSVLSGLILILWVIAGRIEWCLPVFLENKIRGLIKPQVPEITEVMLLTNFEFKELQYDDLEKEIYIVRKSSRQAAQNIVVNVKPNFRKILTEDDKERTKSRLERRFPGLIINYTKDAEEEKHVLLYPD